MQRGRNVLLKVPFALYLTFDVEQPQHLDLNLDTIPPDSCAVGFPSYALPLRFFQAETPNYTSDRAVLRNVRHFEGSPRHHHQPIYFVIVYFGYSASFTTLFAYRITNDALQNALPRPLPPRHSGDHQLLPPIPSAQGHNHASNHIKRDLTTRRDDTAPWHSRSTGQRRHPQLLLLATLFVLDGTDSLPMDRQNIVPRINGTRIINIQ
jgi:hypothetical protein